MKIYFQKLISFLIMTSLTFAILVNSARAGGSDPTGVLQSIADQMIDGLKTNKATLKNNPGLVFSLANRIIVPHADLAEMSKRVLPPATWNKATSTQREQFEREFTTLLVRTYATALAQYTDQTVKFYPIRGGYQGKNNVLVNSQIIRNDGPAISMTYRLLLVGSEWKLYDMTVEGVSLLESFRSQFADELTRGDMSSLIQVLKQHNQANAGSTD